MLSSAPTLSIMYKEENIMKKLLTEIILGLFCCGYPCEMQAMDIQKRIINIRLQLPKELSNSTVSRL